MDSKIITNKYNKKLYHFNQNRGGGALLNFKDRYIFVVEENFIYQIDIQTGEKIPIQIVLIHLTIPTCPFVFSKCNSFLYYVSPDNHICKWDIIKKKTILLFKKSIKILYIKSVDVSPDDNYLLVLTESNIILYDTQTGIIVYNKQINSFRNNVKISSDNNNLFFLNQEYGIVQLNIKENKEICHYQIATDNLAFVLRFFITKDNKYLYALTSKELYKWEIGKNDYKCFPIMSCVKDYEWTEDGKYLLTIEYDAPDFIPQDNYITFKQIYDHNNEYSHIFVSPDVKYIFDISNTYKIRQIDFQTEKVIHYYEYNNNISHMMISDDNNFLFTSEKDGVYLRYTYKYIIMFFMLLDKKFKNCKRLKNQNLSIYDPKLLIIIFKYLIDQTKKKIE